ncbi:Sensor protein PfeS [BD1-7 clade bacterium]|uniref:histidine kinase n=1 Tax=BD1-7 clade bacterium TaxID=2029982 RepID=A0A5S9NLJ2_9GAMM|nr:Sensor protein PfeS [BD1-7 clade bacterium]CAA0094459.1 Sensor protein PfeS [BD1-7 clade bacterium]
MKRSVRFGSLFWKLFLLVWLTNVTVIALTSFYVVSVSQARLADQHFSDRIPTYVRPIINAWENKPSKRLSYKREKHLDKMLRHDLRSANIRIYTDDGELVYERFRTKPHAREHDASQKSLIPSKIRETEFVSDAGHHYRVEAYSPARKHWLPRSFIRLHLMQFSALMLGAALVSFMATYLIQRPLNKLRTYTRALSTLDFDTQLDQKMLARKDTIGDLARTTDQMAINVATMIENRQALLNDVSHELRAPLARLQAAAALIEQKSRQANDVPDANIQRLHQECERMHQLIARIIELSRAGHTEDIALTSLNNTIQQVVDDCRFRHPDRTIHWTQEAQPSVSVNADQQLLSSAIDNVLENACQHTPTDSSINLDLAQQSNKIVLRIRDHGPGINDEDIEQVMRPFQRADQQMHTEGFGLGLSIAVRALEHCGGKLALKNHPEGGLLVTISLPA